jgi:ATP-dependent RNA helicase SUPV3L1/SUV3
MSVQDRALGSLANTQPGDCIVCFNKNDIYNVSRNLERLGKEVAVIYGSLPPNTKLAMASKVAGYLVMKSNEYNHGPNKYKDTKT